MPRATKLTAKLESNLVDAIRAGSFVTVACEAFGVGTSTFYRWMNSSASRYRAFQDKIARATAEAEVANVTIIRQAAVKDWHAAAWYLERKHFNRWGPLRLNPDGWGKIPTKVAITAGEPLQVTSQVYELDLEALPVEALEAIVKQFEEQGITNVIDGTASPAPSGARPVQDAPGPGPS